MPKKPMTAEERKIFTKAFRASSGKKMRGKSGDAAAAVKKHRASKVINKVKRFKNPANK